MRHATRFALFLIVLSAFAASASAQNVYRCGNNSYGQAPCPGGTPVATDDPRTAQQKSQADAATRSDARTADALEKARLQREAQAAAQAAQAARTAAPPPARAASATPSADTRKIVSRKKGRRHEPEYFTAKAPDDKKKLVAKNSRKAGKTRNS
jgi:hypothetical protein